MQPPDRPLPESLTRFLSAPRAAIRPTRDDRHRPVAGRSRPRAPTWVFKGVWLWTVACGVIGGAILQALWRSMAG